MVTFDELRQANMARVGQFKGNAGQPAHTEPDGSDWSPNDWFTASAGELGELGNLLKKLRRGDFKLNQQRAGDASMTYREWIASELAGTIIYLDLLAKRLDIDTGQAVFEEFNRVSRRIGCDVLMTHADVAD